MSKRSSIPRLLGVAPLLALFATAVSAGAAPPPPPHYRVVGSVPGPDGGWDLTSVDPVAGRLYVARSEAIMALDLATNRVTPAVVPAQRGHSAFVIPGTRDVISTNGTSNTAVIFDGMSGKVRSVIAVGKKPDAVAFDPLTRTVWVMNADGGDISVVDPRSAKVVATVMVGGSLELGVADGSGRIFVNVEDRNDVAVLDTRARKLIARFPLTGCEGPTGIAYARDVRLLVSACANGRAIVSTREGVQVANLQIGARPDGALYDEQRHVILIPSGGDGTLAVIRLDGSPRVVETVKTAIGARTGALDAVTGRVYLSAADFAPAEGAKRPSSLPGTYRVLIVAPATERTRDKPTRPAVKPAKAAVRVRAE